jgi:proteasome lid subunit RPN8/RPN11
VDEPLRVSMSRAAYADLIGHAKQSLDAEICGVLVGETCEDEHGIYVAVLDTIRGAGAKQGGAHVTFTQETWNEIHRIKERDHPKLQIVGWYHSHPGFGVEFSEMDLFIQRNFFAGPSQIAFVVDPLGGEEAMCVNAVEGIQFLSRFWVDGRERRCRGPGVGGASSGSRDPTSVAATDETLRCVEERLSQVIRALDDQRATFYRFLLGVGLLAGVAVAVWLGYSLYSQYTAQRTPPTLQQYVPIPVKIGDKTCLLGVAVTRWDVPPELDAIYREMARLQLEAEQAKKAAAEKAAQTQPADAAKAPQPSTAPADNAAGSRTP